MLIKKLQSRLRLEGDPAQRGLTLLEVLIASGIGVLVLGLVVNAYMGANKAQSMSVATGLIKAAGQTALHDVYEQLHQSHVILERGAIADDWLTRVPIDGYYVAADKLTPGYTYGTGGDLQLPLMMKRAAFAVEDVDGNINPDFVQSAVGNALLFVTTDPQAVMKEETSSTQLNTVFGTPEYRFTTYRLHFIYLAQRPLPIGMQPIRTGSNYTYQLMSWTSEPYLDYGELFKWMNKLKDGAATNAYIDTKLDKLRTPDDTPAGTGPYAGAIDLTSKTGAGAIKHLVAATTPDHRDLTASVAADHFKTFRFGNAAKMDMRTSVGTLMVAFNTTAGGSNAAVPIRGIDVPAYAADTTDKPMGFEVMVGGPADRREAMVRLTLAGNTVPGNLKLGQTFQQVVQVFAEVPAIAPTAMATPTPTPTPTPAPTPTPYI